MTRPPESWSSVATCLASTGMFRMGSTMIPVANRSRVVRDAQ
jgi:hypothetical protein